MKFILKTLSFVLLLGLSLAQSFGAKPILKVDTQKVELRKLDAKKLESYKKDRSFIYEEQPIESLSWLDRFYYKLLKFLSHLYPETTWKRVVYITILLGFFLLIGFLILQKGLPGLFYKSKSIPQNVSLGNDLEATDGDLEKGIEAAIQKQDYRLAIRYLFSKSLKLLVSKDLIRWQVNKTNRDYAYELKDEPLRSSFVQLSDLFEYTWYGNFVVGSQVFDSINAEFNQFFKTFSLEETVR